MLFKIKRYQTPPGWVLLHDALDEVALTLFGAEWEQHHWRGNRPYRITRRRPVEGGLPWKRRAYSLEAQGTDYKLTTTRKNLPSSAVARDGHARRTVKMMNDAGSHLQKLLEEGHLSVRLRSRFGQITTDIADGLWRAQWLKIFETGFAPVLVDGQVRYMLILIDGQSLKRAITAVGKPNIRLPKARPDNLAVQKVVRDFYIDLEQAGVKASKDEWREIVRRNVAQACGCEIPRTYFDTELWKWMGAQGWSMPLGKKAGSGQRERKVAETVNRTTQRLMKNRPV